MKRIYLLVLGVLIISAAIIGLFWWILRAPVEEVKLPPGEEAEKAKVVIPGMWPDLTLPPEEIKALGNKLFDFQEKEEDRVYSPGKIKIQRLGHATIMLTSVKGKRILIDPWFKDNPEAPAEFKKIENLKDVDIVLITHGHLDHFTPPELREIVSMYNAEIICDPVLAITMGQQWGLAATWLSVGGKLVRDNILIHSVPALHSSFVQLGETQLAGGGPVGYVIEFENGYKVYISGDTGLFGDMKTIIGDYYKPDLAIIVAGGILNIGGKEAAYAAHLVNPKIVIPYHYGLPIFYPPTYQFVDEMKEKYPEIEVKILEAGEEISI